MDYLFTPTGYIVDASLTIVACCIAVAVLQVVVTLLGRDGAREEELRREARRKGAI